jgi:hypothetical protein
MDADVFARTRDEQISRAMTSYQNARQGYQQSLEAALDEQDAGKRAALLQSVVQQNQQLTTIVQGILQSLKTTEDPVTSEKLESQLEVYRKQLGAIGRSGDHIDKLKNLLNQATQSATVAQGYYVGYLFAILLLVLIVLMFLFYSSPGRGGEGPPAASSISIPGRFSFTPG